MLEQTFVQKHLAHIGIKFAKGCLRSQVIDPYESNPQSC